MRFRPYFTIRDLFWLTLVVALVVGWSLNRSRLESTVKEQDLRTQLLETKYERLKGHDAWLAEIVKPRLTTDYQYIPPGRLHPFEESSDYSGTPR